MNIDVARVTVLILISLFSLPPPTDAVTPPWAIQASGALPQPRPKFKHNAKIRSTYNRAKDETLVLLYQLEPVPVDPAYDFIYSELTMTVSFTYRGAVPSRPEIVTFDFVWMSYDWQFNKRSIVTAKIDKDRVDLGEAEKVGYLGLPEG